MNERLAQELAILKTRFPDIEFLEQDSGWFRIPKYPLPEGVWSQAECSVCFQVPPGYPGQAPYGFWVSPGLTAAVSNAKPGSYSESSATPFPGQWGKFSWQQDCSWHPGADPIAGTNLLNFALTFNDRLRQGA